ncbi:response regulator transcription factor [Streptomyces sp. ISL-12]|uniref:helix-turn-helix transcriptional regulator n=1 Tax=Streptomyces sp. ISL-12 TaxID=2819177 RepID=UPI001BE51782|nr:LuxR C-terminal-related transcriptional regulator [Streptomyces sp. ISL-12]MBT2414689.1 response regulator transcription factor [Streptomyces sp. ISL-12]
MTVHSTDPLSGAGVTHRLEHHPDVRMVDDASAVPGTVAVFVADTLDNTTSVRLHRHGRTTGACSVLVVRQLTDSELLEALAARVRVVLRHHDTSAERLHQAVRTASRGHGDLPPDLLGRVLEWSAALSLSRHGATAAPPDAPSSWEVTALRLLADGLGTEEMARTLGCSTRTAKKRVSALLDRLGLRNRAHAVAYAWREGLI